MSKVQVITVAPSEVDVWLDQHPKEREALRGKHFAFQSNVGVVAVGNSINEIYDELKAKNLLDKIVFSTVPEPIVPIYGSQN